MVKVIKLPIQYKDISGKMLDIFMIEYSDNDLFNKGEFIVDDINENITSEYLENYINIELYKKYKSWEERRKAIENFVYKIDCPGNGEQINSFLKSLYRDYKLDILI